MGKKMKGGRRQILQLEEKKPPKVPSKSKVKSLIHYSDSDDDSKKSNESESSTSALVQNKDATPLESQIADFFKEIDALSVPEELLEEPNKKTSSTSEKISENTSEASSSETAIDLPATTSKDDSHSDASSKEAYCPWQEICDSSTGYSYYWNVQTNEVTWDCPSEYAAFTQSINVSHEKAIHTTPVDKNVDGKEKKRKKNDIVVPEGAIIPISYFGNSSSSDDSSDSESELSSKKLKSEKVSEIKKTKTVKKVDSRSKPNEGDASEIIGPSLPPDFQFPHTETVENETDSQMTVSRNEVDEFVEVGSSLPVEPLNDIIEKPSQSNLDEFPTESTTRETSRENSLQVTEKKNVQSNEKDGDDSPDSTVKKGDCHNAYQASHSTFGIRSVVEYDSFTDDEEEISVTNISSSKLNTDEKNCEVRSSNLQKTDNMAENSSKVLSEAENEINRFKRKVSDVLNENTRKEILIKKPKRNDVNIDSIFASSSTYGKYGFGFGWQKQINEQNDELCTVNDPDYKTKKHQSEFKMVSFVKSEDILDLKALNDDTDTLPEESIQTNTVCDQSDTIEQNEEPLLNDEELVEDIPLVESIKTSSDPDVGSTSIVSIKDKIDCSILIKKKKNADLCKAKFTSIKIEDDLDEIDKALCEALDAKKSAKASCQKSSAQVSNVSNTSKSMVESATSVVPIKKDNEAEFVKVNPIDGDAMTDDILEISSDLIDKLTFLLSTPSTHASFNGVFFQLQTRFVDWQAGALDSKYFMARLKELEQYIQHYETGVISGEWTYQWDRCEESMTILWQNGCPSCYHRENKRYFFINTRTQHSQWTYPEELCNPDKSSRVQSQAEPGPSSASSFTAERDDLQTVSSSSTMHENSPQKHPSSFTVESKDNSSGTRWILQPSPPPPPPGVDSPPLPPRTPPPKSPPPPPPDSTETLREPEDMDIENSNDSSSFLFVNNKSIADDGRIQFISMSEHSSKRSPVSFANALFNTVSSTSMPSCENLKTVPKLHQSISHSLDSSEINNVHWSRPSCSSQLKTSSDSTSSASVSRDVPVKLKEDINTDTHPCPSNGASSSQTDALLSKPTKPVNSLPKKEKKKAKIQPGLGLKKKNIPSLVEKWQKIKEQQDREDNNPVDSKSANAV